MIVIEGGGVTSARGYRAGAVTARIKPGSERPDLALVLSDRPAAAAAVFTTNRVQAAPILVDREHLRQGCARAVILNAGNANACTGAQGVADARRTCELTAAALGVRAEEVLVCSTGVIGVPMPMPAVQTALPALTSCLAADGGPAAARAIMTTDTVPKEIAVEIAVAGRTVRIGGMAKGAGMIAPHMATMLSVVTTDAAIDREALQALLSAVVERSFNCVTVDGDMSTNDTLIVLANGAGGVEVGPGAPAHDVFAAALEHVCRQLARMIARDGEGATKLVPVQVRGAVDEAEARRIGLSVANSNLVKTAIFGNDPNWGRILCAAGYAGVDFDPDQVEVSLCGVPIFRQGGGLPFDKAALSQAMRADEVLIRIELQRGSAAAEVFTCDFSYDYVRINADYTT
jgi:glutamate N-acetyltransferase/amino-acid N-acetyltransferase